jgi:flagellar hook assembly protein FlgD
MIENHRSNLLWEKFMANPEIPAMLDSIGFVPDSTVDVKDEKISVDDFKIIGNYPNPFNPSTTIVFTLPKTEKVVISIYNVLGEEIIKLADREFISGKNEVTWNGTDKNGSVTESGIYFYTIKYQDRIQTSKMVLTK